MQLNETVKTRILEAIKNRTSESFEVKVAGRLRHFVSSEGQKKGMYLGTIQHDNKEFKIYMC